MADVVVRVKVKEKRSKEPFPAYRYLVWNHNEKKGEARYQISR